MALKLRRIGPQAYILPAMVYVSILTIFPSIYLFYISAFNFSLYSGGPSTFAGLGNYISALTDPGFQQSVGLTLGYSAFVTVVEIALGLGVALILNRPGKLISTVRTSMMIPLVMTPFLILMMWRYLTEPDLGPLTYLLSTITGNRSVTFFASVPEVYISMMVIDVWQWLPFVITILLAGLSSIPRAPLEAADIDGATGMKKLRYVTLPLLKSTFAIVLLFRLIDSFKDFEIIYLFTGGGPGTATNFLSWNIFETGLGIVENIGLSSAYAVMFLILTIAISWPLMYWMYRLRK